MTQSGILIILWYKKEVIFQNFLVQEAQIFVSNWISILSLDAFQKKLTNIANLQCFPTAGVWPLSTNASNEWRHGAPTQSQNSGQRKPTDETIVHQLRQEAKAFGTS